LVAFSALALMSVFGGRAFKGVFTIPTEHLSYISTHHEIFIYNPLRYAAQHDTLFQYIAFFLTLHAVFLVFYGIHFLQSNKREVNTFFQRPFAHKLFCFFNRKCYFDDVYDVFVVWPVLKFSNFCNIAIENGIFKYFTTTFLWQVIIFPVYSRVTRANFTVVDHLAYTSAGLLSGLIVSYLVSVL